MVYMKWAGTILRRSKSVSFPSFCSGQLVFGQTIIVDREATFESICEKSRLGLSGNEKQPEG
jgi:hypothetical protein